MENIFVRIFENQLFNMYLIYLIQSLINFIYILIVSLKKLVRLKISIHFLNNKVVKLKTSLK